MIIINDRIVGHSLGGGIATLLSLLLKKKHPNFPLHCYSFAPPPVADLVLAEQAKVYFFILQKLRIITNKKHGN